MKKFKKGELEVVDYILNYVFNIADGDWGSYKVGDIIEYDVELDWLDMKLCNELNIEKMMMEISENELWEGFGIEDEDGEVVWNVKRKEVRFGEVYEVSVKYVE